MKWAPVLVPSPEQSGTAMRVKAVLRGGLQPLDLGFDHHLAGTPAAKSARCRSGSGLAGPAAVVEFHFGNAMIGFSLPIVWQPAAAAAAATSGGNERNMFHGLRFNAAADAAAKR